MALTSTLGSPGIEIREIDNSLRLDTSTGTTVYIPGFAAQGPVDEVMSIGSIEDFETIYGVPSNAAERYFYYTVKSILDNTGGGTTVLCTRLPYGDSEGDTVSNQYTLMAYPAVPVIKNHYYKTKTADGSWEISDEQTENSSEVTFSFDQFVMTSSVQQEKLQEAFIVNIANVEGDEVDPALNVSELTPTILDYVLTIDDNEKNVDKLEISQILEDGVEIPELGKTIDLTDFDISTQEIAAPVIKFNNVTENNHAENEFVATGFMALEAINGTEQTESILHLSYSIKKNVDEDNDYNLSTNGTKVGSLYLKLKYDIAGTDLGGAGIKGYTGEETTTPPATGDGSDTEEGDSVVEGQSIVGLEEIDQNARIIFTLVTSQKVCDSFTGDGSDDVTYIVGSPVSYQVSLNDYYKILTGEKLEWQSNPYDFNNVAATDEESTSSEEVSQFGHFDALGHAAFIVLNTSRSIINNNFEGLYLGLTDNTFVTPYDDYFIYNAVESVKTTTKTYDNSDGNMMGIRDSIDNTADYQNLHQSRLAFKLADNAQGAISKILARDCTAKDISSTAYDDTISMCLFKLTKTTDDSDIVKLNYSIREKYNWSFGKTRMRSSSASTNPVSYFAETVVEDSNNLAIMINPYIAEKAYIDTAGTVHGKMRIFGNKLLNNLERLEESYLRKTYENTEFTMKSCPALNFAKLAQSAINSWADVVYQCGVTPRFIKNTFANYSMASSENASGTTYANFHPLNSLLPFGAFSDAESDNKRIGEVPAKLERALQLVENDELYPDIDIVLESGLGTVYINAKGDLSEEQVDSKKPITGTFDDATVLKGIEDLRTGRSSLSDLAQNVKENYVAVQNVFTRFANAQQNGGRGDCFYISDIPRQILIKGKDTKIPTLFGTKMEGTSYDLGDSVNHSFPTSIYYPIFHTFDSIVSSYMSTYAQWVKVLDKHTAKKVWIPISGFIAANMCATDTVYGPWYAAAGLRRGVINGILDYAISPNVSQRTDLYKICINSVPKLPNYGVTIWGIRTMSKKDSAFDQNTCRRTFLYMEKKVKQLLRYYLFEPNNSFTRLQIYNDIDPFLEGIKNNGGVYAYTLVCDTTINTPEVINNGDLAIRISAAPTRTAENIVVEFVANKYTEDIASSEG